MQVARKWAGPYLDTHTFAMDSATSSFNTYEQDFKVLIHSIRSQFDGDEGEVQTGTVSCVRQLLQSVNLTFLDAEQRKATSRRVEMELEEADEMVSIPTTLFPTRIYLQNRSHKWKSRFKPFPIHNDLHTSLVYGQPKPT